MIDGHLVLVGTHHRGGRINENLRSVDARVGFEPATLAAEMDAASGGVERPCFVSFSRNYVLGDRAWQRVASLKDHVGSQQVFGDVTGDYRLDEDDMLAMEAEIRAHQDAEDAGSSYAYNSGFDLNDDGDIDLADFQTMMTEGFKTSRADVVGQDKELGPDGFTRVLDEAFLIVGNLGMVDATLADGDLNLDGTVSVLGDAFLLVAELNKVTLLRLDLDFDNTGDSAGILDAADIDALVANMVIDPDDQPPYNEAFDLTSDPEVTDPLPAIPGIADGVVNGADLVFFVQEVLGTQFGDVDLNGVVDSDDFDIARFNNLNGTGAGWSGGDVDFNGVIDIEDVNMVLNYVLATQ